MPTPLDGPRLPPLSGVARQLVVFLHGYGADGRDLIDIGEEWRAWLPDAAFVAPHAPDPCDEAPTGRQWFPLLTRDPHDGWRGSGADRAGVDARWTGVVQARPALDAFLDSELSRWGLRDRDLALVGFSQGTMMALHAGLRRASTPAAILGYSGMLVGPERLAEEATAAPPILLVHGDQDPVIPVQAMFQAAIALAQAGIGCQWRLCFGLEHGIDADGLRGGGQFLAQQLLGRTPGF